MQVQGAITTITSKEIFTGKMKRAANIYSFKVTGDDNWYKTGFEALKATEGDEVSFDASQTQYGWNVDATAIRVLGRAEAPVVTTINKIPAGSMTKDDYWKNREDRDQTVQRTIQYQSARNSSIATVSAALAAGILTIPKAQGKQFDAFVMQVDKLTDTFFNNINIHDKVEDEEDETEFDMYADDAPEEE